MQEFWVFGYGSLMWRPGFAFEERREALLRGAHRRLCVYSWVHRGTAERPGLVLGLDRGGACRGIAFRIGETRREQVLGYLREREQITMVYREALRPVRLLGDRPREVTAVCYLVDRRHRQYAGALTGSELIGYVRQGVGRSGTCRDYVRSTVDHLREMGIFDPLLEAVYRALAREETALPLPAHS